MKRTASSLTPGRRRSPATTAVVRLAASLVLAAAGLVASAGLLAACGRAEESYVRAFRAQSRLELIGGPAALAEIGDYILENDQVRFAILQPGNSVGPGVFGGSIVDADLKRPEHEFRAGRGLDQFSEMFPTMNLLIPHPDKTDVLVGPNPARRCPLVDPGGGYAALCVRGPGDNFLYALGVLSILIGSADFQTDYILRPGTRALEMVTTLDLPGVDPNEAPVSLPAFTAPKSILDAIVGDQFKPPEERKLAGGVMAGDFLLFGKKVEIFGPGVGFDTANRIRDVFLRGGDTISNPVPFRYLVGVGDRVSYAVLNADGPEGGPGEQLVPIFSSSFTAVFSHGRNCLYDNSDHETCADRHRVQYRRYLVVGEGDVASALDDAYRLWKVPTGEVVGSVVDGRTFEPVPGADILVFEDPLGRVSPALSPPPECDRLRGGAEAALAYSLFTRCAQAVSVDAANPEGQPLAISHMRSNVGTAPHRDGRFRGALPAGTYYIGAKTRDRGPPLVQRIVVQAGGQTGVLLPLARVGRVEFDVRDQSGRNLPAKLTVVGKDADGDGVIDAGLKYLEFGDPFLPEGMVQIVRSASGIGEFGLEPGRYRVIASHGIEFSVDSQEIDVPNDGRPVLLRARLDRQVDTRGYVSADFHVHGVNSYDSTVSHRDRVESFVVEGVEILSSADHDYITDHAPTVRALGLRDRLHAQVGLEVTPVELGHFVGFPLRYDQTLPEHGALDWSGLSPAQIFDGLRQSGSLGPAETVVLVPHPRDHFFGYFDQFGMNAFTLRLSEQGALQRQNPILADLANFDTSFQAIELFNGKRYDMIRTPTVGEISEFAAALKEIREGSDPPREQRRRENEVATALVRRVLSRTPEESRGLEFERDGQRCQTADACAPSGQICNLHSGACIADPASECPPGASCAAGERCEKGRCACDPEAKTSACASGLVCSPAIKRCLPACKTHFDCRPTEFCCAGGDCGAAGSCQKAQCKPIEAENGGADRPCVPWHGVIDDWFRLLNHGVNWTGLGTSDTHDLTEIESGVPRSYLCSSVDEPALIDEAEIAHSIRDFCAITTYGPFVELFVNRGHVGETVAAKQGGLAEVRVRVQSPDWFDVDRVEVYRNGVLGRVFVACKPGESGVRQGGCPEAGSQTCIPLDKNGHNTDLTNLDTCFTEKLERDSWFVAIALGMEAKPEGPWSGTLSPVYTPNAFPNLGFSEIVLRAFAGFNMGIDISALLGELPETPQVSPLRPYGVTNPVWVTLGSGKFQPPAPLPDFAKASGAGAATAAVAEVGAAPSTTVALPLSGAGKASPPYGASERRRHQASDTQRSSRVLGWFQQRLAEALNRGR